MKISYDHIVNKIDTKPSIHEVSEKLFQLGHEHEIDGQIFDIEFTPNRGDCLSLKGLMRDLKLFYDIQIDETIYEKKIEPLHIEFVNNALNQCPRISFLKIEIEEVPKKFRNFLEEYFTHFGLNKNNFFTDISNYVAYETGQPTHCYDSSKIDDYLRLDFLNEDISFNTLLDKEIELKKGDLVFFDKTNSVINVAGIIGGKNTSCNKNTKSVIVECAYFNPEAILGKSVKYSIHSEAAYKFERNVDIDCHNYALRRFIKIVESHTKINKIQLFTENTSRNQSKILPLEVKKINKILGTNVSTENCIDYLQKLEFEINDDQIIVPSHRNDIVTTNDIAEEIARSIGYDNIDSEGFSINLGNNNNGNLQENKIRNLLFDHGFFEVINNPFVSSGENKAIEVDNPLDSNRKFLRTSLKESLINNLIYNERRQHDSIKIFEIADVYNSLNNHAKRMLGIIASGRIDKNYKDFSKKIDDKLIYEMLCNYVPNLNVETIPRDIIKSKLKDHISYAEIDLGSLEVIDYNSNEVIDINSKNYKPISEFPSSKRDISFSVLDINKFSLLQDHILSIDHNLIKEIFIFDYFYNKKTNEIKIGFRFVFQAKEKTITDDEVNEVIEMIIDKALSIETVSIPGLIKF